jgi:hypothetical protein
MSFSWNKTPNRGNKGGKINNQTTKARLGTLENIHMYRMEVSFTCRNEMEMREMQKTAVNITLVELGKLTFSWTIPPQTR